MNGLQITRWLGRGHRSRFLELEDQTTPSTVSCRAVYTYDNNLSRKHSALVVFDNCEVWLMAEELL